MSKCKANCGFFGTDQFEGYCSSCYRKIVKKELPVQVTTKPKATYTPPNPTFTNEDEFQVLVRLIANIRECTARKIDTVLQTLDVYLTEDQARRLLTHIGKVTLEGNNFIYHHVVYCRVVDRSHLESGFGAEGYYHVEEGVKPPDNYAVWDHQSSFLDD